MLDYDFPRMKEDEKTSPHYSFAFSDRYTLGGGTGLSRYQRTDLRSDPHRLVEMENDGQDAANSDREGLRNPRKRP